MGSTVPFFYLTFTAMQKPTNVQPSTILSEIKNADRRIRPHILTTPLIEDRHLSRLISGKAYLKLENEQYTGSFKARGSLNKLLSLNEEEKQRGAITASTGNHALGFARALEIAGVNGVVYLPENASVAKVETLKNYEVELRFHGTDSLATELFAKAKALAENRIWISPYNDLQIIGGQGTIGIELLEQCPHFDAAFITVGGGGLIGGVATYLKTHHPAVQIVGCQPANSPEMTLSLQAGEIVDYPNASKTLSDGSAGGIEAGAITFPICKNVIDEMVLISEEEIEAAIRHVACHHHKIIEGAAGVAVAGLMKMRARFVGKTVVVLICGGNIALEEFRKLI